MPMMGWDDTLPRVLLALAAWTLVWLLAAYYAVTRLGAVQAVLALVARRALRRVEAADGGGDAEERLGAGGKPAVRATCRRTATGEAKRRSAGVNYL